MTRARIASLMTAFIATIIAVFAFNVGTSNAQEIPNPQVGIIPTNPGTCLVGGAYWEITWTVNVITNEADDRIPTLAVSSGSLDPNTDGKEVGFHHWQWTVEQLWQAGQQAFLNVDVALHNPSGNFEVVDSVSLSNSYDSPTKVCTPVPAPPQHDEVFADANVASVCVGPDNKIAVSYLLFVASQDLSKIVVDTPSNFRLDSDVKLDTWTHQFTYSVSIDATSPRQALDGVVVKFANPSTGTIRRSYHVPQIVINNDLPKCDIGTPPVPPASGGVTTLPHTGPGAVAIFSAIGLGLVAVGIYMTYKGRRTIEA